MRLVLPIVAALTGAILSIPAADAAPVSVGLSGTLQSRAAVDPLVIQVQHWRRDGPRRHPGPPPRRGGGRDDGGAIAAGILGGLLLGAIIASESQRQQGVEYCMRRYRSYDPYSMTFRGYDGRRYRCP